MAINLNRVSMYDVMEESVKLKLEVDKVKEQFLNMLQSNQSFSQPPHIEKSLSTARDRIHLMYEEKSAHPHRKHSMKKLKRFSDNKENTPPRLKRIDEKVEMSGGASNLYFGRKKMCPAQQRRSICGSNLNSFSCSSPREPLNELHLTSKNSQEAISKTKSSFSFLPDVTENKSYHNLTSTRCTNFIDNSKRKTFSDDSHKRMDKSSHQSNESCGNLSGLSAFTHDSLVHEHRSSSNINDVFHSTMNYPLHSTMYNLEEMISFVEDKNHCKDSHKTIQMESNPQYEQLKALNPYQCVTNHDSNHQRHDRSVQNYSVPKYSKHSKRHEQSRRKYSSSKHSDNISMRKKIYKELRRNELEACPALDICQYESFYNTLLDKSSLLSDTKSKSRSSKKNMPRELGISNLHDSDRVDLTDDIKCFKTDNKRKHSLPVSSVRKKVCAPKTDINNLNSMIVKKCSKLTSENLTKLLCF